ncbi:GNAT family N-acetyltransferase [Novipirellula sp.]|uniref:GNAT family N-acetyltransferase n=1 Tax=Novipirellula sp. TaxID=2795430 RepID=UPI0035679F27
MELFIRKAEREDAIAVWDIRNAAILAQCTGHYPEEQLSAWTAGEMTDAFAETVAKHWYVATVDGSVVGTGLLDCSTGQVDAIFVRPDRMGCGVGRAILAHLECLAAKIGLRRLTLDSTLNAAPFYRQCGFVGDQRSVYESPRGISLACIPMVKQLVTSPIAGEQTDADETSASSSLKPKLTPRSP